MQKNIFDMLTSVLWEDTHTFLREEKKALKDIHYYDLEDIPFILFFIPIINFYPLLVGAIRFGFAPFHLLWTMVRRNKIIKNAYDIEVSTNAVKLIRNSNGLLGICYWENWYNNSLLLHSKYLKIIRINESTFIVCQDKQFGLFNTENRKFVLPIKFSEIKVGSGDFVEAIDSNGRRQKYNFCGERILW